jgi:spore coat polysaccharide biosynthesis protein SpsF
MSGVVTVVQARTGSTRLPGKVLLPLSDAPALLRLVERVRTARFSGTVVVATTTLAEDDVIETLCRAHDVPVFRGHPTDLLDRHVRAARAFGAEHVVKIPSDCPLIDPAAIDRVVGFFLADEESWDYASNLHPATWPDGNDVEIMPLAALETAWREAVRACDREHTTPFLWDHPERFRVGNVLWEAELDLSATHRFTLDYAEDHAFLSEVYAALYPVKPHFTLRDVLELLAERPALRAINARHLGTNWYARHLHELRTITPAEARSATEAA